MDELVAFAKPLGIAVVEDAAQTFGSSYRGRSAGSWGDIGCFSFYPTKNLGALVTHSEMLSNAARLMIDHGQITRDQHERVGRNSRIDSIQAGFLNVHLDFFDSWQSKRKRLAALYVSRLSAIKGITLPASISESRHNGHLFVIQVEKRNEIKSFLAEQGIGTAVHYPSIIPEMVPYWTEILFPVAESVSNHALSLPLNPFMEESDVKRVCMTLEKYFLD